MFKFLLKKTKMVLVPSIALLLKTRKIITIKTFCKSCLRCFNSEKVFITHKEDFLMINGKPNVKLEKGFISFKNFKKQIPIPF